MTNFAESHTEIGFDDSHVDSHVIVMTKTGTLLPEIAETPTQSQAENSHIAPTGTRGGGVESKSEPPGVNNLAQSPLPLTEEDVQTFAGLLRNAIHEECPAVAREMARDFASDFAAYFADRPKEEKDRVWSALSPAEREAYKALLTSPAGQLTLVDISPAPSDDNPKARKLKR